MNPKLEQIADLISRTQHCEAALEPVVCHLIADKTPTEAIIAALASLTALAVDHNQSTSPNFLTQDDRL